MAEKKPIDYLVGKHFSSAGARQSMVSGKFDMSNAMTVLADRNKVADFFFVFVGVCHV